MLHTRAHLTTLFLLIALICLTYVLIQIDFSTPTSTHTDSKSHILYSEKVIGDIWGKDKLHLEADKAIFTLVDGKLLESLTQINICKKSPTSTDTYFFPTASISYSDLLFHAPYGEFYFSSKLTKGTFSQCSISLLEKNPSFEANHLEMVIE